MLLFAPKIIGGGATAPTNISFAGYDKMNDALMLERMHVEQLGQDVCITGYPRYERGEE
ncbi:hypothetical protein D3C80_2234990 [compost metagenome]